MSKLRIRHVNPAELKPHPENDDSRTMEPAEREALRRILRQFGLVEPLVVNTRNGYMISGHRRREIAIEEGWDEVPITERDLSDDEHIALMVGLNNERAQGQYSLAGLTTMMAKIEDTPLLEATGFSFDQWQGIQLEAADERLKAGREGATPPLPPHEDTKTKPGDIWALGTHTLVVGDATQPEPYPPSSAPADMTFTDPPYNVDYQGGTAEELDMLNDAWETHASYAVWLQSALAHTRERTSGAVYLCHAMSQSAAVHDAWQSAGLHYSSTIAWIKDRFVLGRADYHWQWEPIIYGWPDGRGPERYWFGSRAEGNVWEHGKPKRGDRGREGPSNVWRYKRPAASRLHPTMKPVAMVEHAIRNSCPPGGLVLDPFGGSGSTLIAAENLGRHSWTIELDPRYADVIIARFESLETGKEVTKQ